MGDTLGSKPLTPYLELAGAIATNLGCLPEEVVRHYVANKDQIPESLLQGFGSPKKFALLCDLGVIIVPDDYVHEQQLDTFRKKHQHQFRYYDEFITDAAYNNPSRVLKPGDRLKVQVFKQFTRGYTTSEERLKFLASQGCVYPGAQGLSLVLEQKLNSLPTNLWYDSWDEVDHLYHINNVDPRISRICVGTDRAFFHFDLYSIRERWGKMDAFLGFTEVREIQTDEPSYSGMTRPGDVAPGGSY